MITARKAKRALFAALPSWLVAVVAFCAILPGWLDDIPPLGVALVLCLAQPGRQYKAYSAWHGGKSHRKYGA